MCALLGVKRNRFYNGERGGKEKEKEKGKGDIQTHRISSPANFYGQEQSYEHGLE